MYHLEVLCIEPSVFLDQPPKRTSTCIYRCGVKHDQACYVIYV